MQFVRIRLRNAERSRFFDVKLSIKVALSNGEARCSSANNEV